MANIERLEQVIRVLREVPDEKFNLAVYYEREFKCGTVACAVGHAALDPWFRRRGFKLGPPATGDDGSITRGPVFAGKEDIDAVAAFFDIPLNEIWESPFYPNAYAEHGGATKAKVIKRIREFIKEHLPPSPKRRPLI